jgi:anthranilate/para-aminobenzoate synthase component II
MILLLDNFDSFTYNVAHSLGELGFEVKVVRSDAITPDEVEKMWPEAVFISPGPGKPSDHVVS